MKNSLILKVFYSVLNICNSFTWSNCRK